MKNKFKLVAVHCFLPLFMGGALYILFRSTELRMFKWFSIFNLDNAIHSARANTFHVKAYLPSWSFYSLPDGLWTYSFSSALIIYWENESHKIKLWLLIPLVTGVFVEIFQGLKWFPGTFDYLDLVFSALGLFFSKLILNHKLKQNEKNSF